MKVSICRWAGLVFPQHYLTSQPFALQLDSMPPDQCSLLSFQLSNYYLQNYLTPNFPLRSNVQVPLQKPHNPILWCQLSTQSEANNFLFNTPMLVKPFPGGLKCQVSKWSTDSTSSFKDHMPHGKMTSCWMFYIATGPTSKDHWARLYSFVYMLLWV